MGLRYASHAQDMACSTDQQTQQTGSHAVVYFFREIKRILTGLCFALLWLCLPLLGPGLALALLGRCGVSRVLVACLASLHPFFLIKRKRERVYGLFALACVFKNRAAQWACLPWRVYWCLLLNSCTHAKLYAVSLNKCQALRWQGAFRACILAS